MQLYSSTAHHFIEKAINNEIAPSLRESFKRYLGYYPSSSETNSWLVSLKDLAFSLRTAELEESGIVVEYRLPQSSKRLDAMITGYNQAKREKAVIVELKQWKAAYRCGVEDCVTFTPRQRGEIHPHPSRQAGSYAEYLKGAHTAFYSDQGEDYVDLEACSFLHQANARTCGDLLDPEYAETLARYPLFTGDLRSEFENYLRVQIGAADGNAVLQRVLQSRYMPSKQLLRHVAEMIEGNPIFTLLDEQLVAYNIVHTKVRELGLQTSKAIVLVVGGPGTGKSVIAVRLLADLAKEGYNIVHCTGSKAFTTNLRAKVGRKASTVFKYFNSFVDEEPGNIDVMVADEAHRIRESSNDRWRRKSTKSQIEEMIDSSKVTVFLLDDNQVVRPGEVGTPALIRDTASRYGAELFQVKLESQYRCAGSEAYLRWLDYTYELGGKFDLSWKEDYLFEIVSSPKELEDKILANFNQGYSARLIAGFCWPWSDPNSDGSLVPDVKIDSWIKPWNRKEKGSPPPHKHPYTIWATQDEGVNEVGCIYSAQGFEFDYCGIIVGKDLVWRNDKRGWTALKENSFDSVVKRSPDLVRHLCNTYRVLMSRAMQGTYVYFMNQQTREHFEKLLTYEYERGKPK